MDPLPPSPSSNVPLVHMVHPDKNWFLRVFVGIMLLGLGIVIGIYLGKLAYHETDSPTVYTCPQSGWADCMPSPDGPAKCTPEYMSWAQANCPNFQGGAY